MHPGEDSDADLCVHCGTRLDGASSQYPQALFRQPTVRAQRWTRITSEEEERVREGYLTTTHFRTSGGAREERTFIEPQTGGAILSARYLPQAQLWRINHGWRKSAEQVGFILDGATGRWRARDDAADQNGGGRGGNLMTGIRPYVTDTRNILLLRPLADAASDQDFLKSLAYALRRALQIEYQVEERELAVELIGREENENIVSSGRPPRAASEFGNASSPSPAISEEWPLVHSKSCTSIPRAERQCRNGRIAAWPPVTIAC